MQFPDIKSGSAKIYVPVSGWFLRAGKFCLRHWWKVGLFVVYEYRIHKVAFTHLEEVKGGILSKLLDLAGFLK